MKISECIAEESILYEKGDHWVCKKIFRSSDGYAVYRQGITHSVLVATIGYSGAKGLKKAIQECDNRGECLRDR